MPPLTEIVISGLTLAVLCGAAILIAALCGDADED